MENLNTTSANTLLEENPTKPLDLDLDAIIPSPVDPNQGDATVDANNKDPSDEDSKSSKVTAASENTTATTTPVTDTEKKIRRAERFGITVQLSEQEKRNSRAERFGTATGTVTGTGSTTKGAEELKRKARAERFGLPVTVNADEEAKEKARLQRFAPTSKTEEDAKKERPSQPSSNSLSMNGKGNVEPKAAIAGKAGGGS